MSMFNKFRNFLFNNPAGEDMGQRAEILVTLTLGVLSTLLPMFVYKAPATIITAVITNTVGFFTLYQAIRGRYKYLPLFPTVSSLAVCSVSIFEGHGTHDLIWMGNLGLFLLANIQSRKRLWFPLFLAVLMIGTFAGAGIAEIAGLTKGLPGQISTAQIEPTPEYILLNSFFFATMMAAIIAIFHRHYSLLEIATKSKSAEVKSNRELQEINQTLEARVETRTRELSEASKQLQQRASRLQTISEISQEIISKVEQQPHELLTRITQVISEKLAFYHVGIFLLDKNREYAVLRAANSSGGQHMLERHHQLRVGGTGIVGYVSQSGRPRIALDTGSDAVFFNNPDLPHTRSEMAIPLKYGSQVIGVLDVQSMQSSALKDEDANLLGTLANQIAITINNILINEQSTHRQDSRNRPGSQFSQRQNQIGYSFNADGTISTASPTENPILQSALASGETVIQNQPLGDTLPALAVPVKFRDQLVGIIHIESAERSRKWTEDEIMVVQSISERAAVALENARLFEETSRRAEQEETIARITSQIGSSTDFNHILQTTVEELGRTLGATRTFIQLEAVQKDAASRQTATD